MPLNQVAIFVCGLRDNSRIMMTYSERKVDYDRLLLANAVDNLSLLVWTKTEDARTGSNRPKRFTDLLLGNKEEYNTKSFQEGSDFLKAWNS